MTLHTTTHFGLRAPNDDELQRNGADAMRDLADDVDTVLHEQLSGLPTDTVRTLHGSVYAATNAFGWMSIVFPVGSFSSAPTVVVSNGNAGFFFGSVQLLEPATTTGFSVVVFSTTHAAADYTRAYAEWAVNHGETTTGIDTRMESGASGQPTLAQYPTNARVNWIAVGPV